MLNHTHKIELMHAYVEDTLRWTKNNSWIPKVQSITSYRHDPHEYCTKMEQKIILRTVTLRRKSFWCEEWKVCQATESSQQGTGISAMEVIKIHNNSSHLNSTIASQHYTPSKHTEAYPTGGKQTLTRQINTSFFNEKNDFTSNGE